MKKVLSILTTLTALAGSASAAGYVLPNYTPGAVIPADWQPTYNIEGMYAHGEHEMLDTWGVRGSFSLYDSGEDAVRHQFSLNIAAELGSKSKLHQGYKEETDLWMVPVTAGYDINFGITDSVFIDFGAKAGWAFGSVESKYQDMKLKEDLNGLTIGFGAGLKFLCSERLYVKVGYELNRTFVKDGEDFNVNQHVFVLGLGTLF